MGRMKCVCGNVMSDSTVPNDVRKWMLKDDEWQDFINHINEGKSGWNFKLSVWYCQQCKRSHVSDEKTTKVFSVINTENIIETCGCSNKEISIKKKVKIWVFNDDEWSNVRATIKEGKSEEITPKSDVWYYPECEKVSVYCRDKQKERIYAIEQEIKHE
jgi:hypothetical protein